MKKTKAFKGVVYHKGQWYELFEILHFIRKREKINPEGKKRNSSTVWFKEYQNAPDGICQKPPYKDFFSWFFKEFPDAQLNDESFYFDVKYLLSQTLDVEIRTILELIQKHLGDDFKSYLSEN